MTSRLLLPAVVGRSVGPLAAALMLSGHGVRLSLRLILPASLSLLLFLLLQMLHISSKFCSCRRLGGEFGLRCGVKGQFPVTGVTKSA
jgi:hypothetical protein